VNKEHTDLLLQRFKFFGQSRWGNLDFREAIQTSVMPFGFECGDGWFRLIWELCEAIEPRVDDDFEVVQVKEKFGGLRFYCGPASKEVYDLISVAEEKSYSVCEECGRKAKQRGGWISTLCWFHWYMDQARRKWRGGKYSVRYKYKSKMAHRRD